MKKIHVFYSYLILSLLAVEKVYASGCYELSADDPPNFAWYLDCMIPRIWSFMQVILIGAGIILLMYNVMQYVMNRSNSKFLETFNQKMIFLVAALLLTAGFGTTIIDIFLQLFSLGGIQGQLDELTDFLELWQ